MTPTNTPLPDLSRLKKVAEAALTFGGAPWAYAAHGRDGGYGVGVCFDEHTGKNLSGEIRDEDFQVSEPVAAVVENSVYARFIATFGPPTVLALIEALLKKEEASRTPAGKCATCRHFTPEESGFGSCARWRTGYGVFAADMATDEALVENDEGWGMLVGRDFGCVLHNPAPQQAPDAPKSNSGADQ